VLLYIVFDAAGGFWFTDFGVNTERSRDFGVISYARADGSTGSCIVVQVLTVPVHFVHSHSYSR
jgi:hypothetical protein